MQPKNRTAFKEWAAVCVALEEGQQSLILRKGGIHEGREGFRVDHSEFWLYPTEFHQDSSVLVEEARPLLEVARSRLPVAGSVEIRDYVTIEEVIEIRDEAILPRLMGLHVWSSSTVQARFQYRSPLLFTLLVRVYSLAQPIVLTESPQFAGCRSWVDLGDDLQTAGLIPRLTDKEHGDRMGRIRAAITGS